MKPFPYQVKLRDLYQSKTKTWQWFSGAQVRDDAHEQFRLDLLSKSYRLDRETHHELYKLADLACERLSLDIPLTIYQEKNAQTTNAGIVEVKGEAHLIFSGSVLQQLSSNEQLALLGHELSHLCLTRIENGSFEVTGRIAQALAAEASSDPVDVESARLFDLFTELYCDQGGMKACGDVEDMITALVKLETGLTHVSASAFLKQSEELLANTDGTNALSHPESHYRARALQRYSEGAAPQEIEDLILGAPHLFSLNIFSRQEAVEGTRRLLTQLLQPSFMQTDIHFAHARHFIPDIEKQPKVTDPAELRRHIDKAATSLKEYYAYVVFDFVMLEDELYDAISGQALKVAEELGLEKEIEKIFKKELSLTDKKYKDLQQKCSRALEVAVKS